ncbi:MAG: MBL fold metallo-hydrolase [Candidatus Hodarchaeales archaeon]|jgi:L-ascorbate metabolism protein UlaG (beta-lactamase superfamily)
MVFVGRIMIPKQKMIFGVISISLIVISSIFLFTFLQTDPSAGRIIRTDKFTYEGVEIERLVSSGFKFKQLSTGLVVYTDPYALDDIEEASGDQFEEADYIFLSHHHMNHYSLIDINKIITPDTVIIAAERMDNRGLEIQFPSNTIHYVNPYDQVNFENITLEILPMYNINKFRFADIVYHPREDNNCAVLVDFQSVRIYHAGDSDLLPEMKSINCDIALLPVGGFALMDPFEAADAVDYLKLSSDLKYAIPFHYAYMPRYLDEEAADLFAEEANCSVVILDNHL